MNFKTKICFLQIDIILLIVILTCIFSYTTFLFLRLFFACYLFILFHEFMHIFVASILGRKLLKIKFLLSGTCAVFEKINKASKKEYFKNIIIYLAGPFSNIFLACIFNENKIIVETNMFLAIVNMLPIYPLDGYNIIYYFLKMIINEKKSTEFIDKLGIIVIILLMTLSIYQIFCYMNITILVFCLYLIILKIRDK